VRPSVHRRHDLPASVDIYEVGARDGLQNEAMILPTATKVELINRLVAAGLRTVEATSFVSPRWVPQLADAAEVMSALRPGPGVRYPVLVPNRRGLDRALAVGARDIAVSASATESFALRNLNQTRERSLHEFRSVVAEAVRQGCAVRGYISMCFGDPWEGDVAIDEVVAVGAALIDMGCSQLSIGDTIGVGTPGHVGDLLAALERAGVGVRMIAVHFHDTYGQALANTVAALEAGVTTVDASVGGLGGCPYARSATGNLATEDLVWLLDGLGIDSGVDLAALSATSAWMADVLDRPSPSRVARALAAADVAEPRA
jgi:hydroxymethylglutaryl-CoA lyase